MIPQEDCQQIAAKWMRQPGDKRETDKKIGTDPQEQVPRKYTSSPSDNFGPPPETSERRYNRRETTKE